MRTDMQDMQGDVHCAYMFESAPAGPFSHCKRLLLSLPTAPLMLIYTYHRPHIRIQQYYT